MSSLQSIADDLRAAVKEAVAARRDDLIDLVSALVRIPSENTPPTGSERAAQEYLFARARSSGLAALLYEFRDLPDMVVHPAFRPGRSYDGRPNLLVNLPADGREERASHDALSPAANSGDAAPTSARGIRSRHTDSDSPDTDTGGRPRQAADTGSNPSCPPKAGAGSNPRQSPRSFRSAPRRQTGRSLLFSGHVDTVPAGDAGWAHPPFDGLREGDRIYGRGAYDMKAGLACGLVAIEILKDLSGRCGLRLQGDLGLESVVDEEFGGVNGTIAGRVQAEQTGRHCDGAVLLEPTNLCIYRAHRGLRVAEVRVTGRAGVSFAGEKLENPICKLGSLVDWFNRFGEGRNSRLRGHPDYRDYELPVPYMMTRAASFEEGSKRVFAVPRMVSLELFWETMPGETKEDIDRALLTELEVWRKTATDLPPDAVTVSFPLEWMPGSSVRASHPLVKSLESALGSAARSQGREIQPVITGAPFPCDAYAFNLFSPTQAILFGPGGGNAHAAEEFVLVEDLMTVLESLCLLAIEWCGADDPARE